MRRFVWMVAAALVTAAAAPHALAAQDVGLPLGTKPVMPVVEDLNGKPVNLAQYVGKKPVVLEFWATWCEVCAALAPKMQAASKRYGTQAQFITVAVGVSQSPRVVKRYLEKHAVPGLLVWDGQGRATRAFEAPGTSHVVILDRQGRVAYADLGEEQDVMGAVGKVLAKKN
jgi:cytochrome c biogenesis protein CcmG/thiol:disulfide interchange protein DsbE